MKGVATRVTVDQGTAVRGGPAREPRQARGGRGDDWRRGAGGGGRARPEPASPANRVPYGTRSVDAAGVTSGTTAGRGGLGGRGTSRGVARLPCWADDDGRTGVTGTEEAPAVVRDRRLRRGVCRPRGQGVTVPGRRRDAPARAGRQRQGREPRPAVVGAADQSGGVDGRELRRPRTRRRRPLPAAVSRGERGWPASASAGS